MIAFFKLLLFAAVAGILFIVNKANKGKSANPVVRKSMRRCPSCGSTADVRVEHWECPHCGDSGSV